MTTQEFSPDFDPVEYADCRNCYEPQELHCTECNACNAAEAYSSTVGDITIKYPQHCYNENYCDVADRYEGIVAKRKAKSNIRFTFQNRYQ